MKNLVVMMIVLGVSPAYAVKKPHVPNCYKEVAARKEARKLVYLCVDEWAKDFRAEDSDPSDDCKKKLNDYIEAAREIKYCKGAPRPLPPPPPAASPATTASPSPQSN